MGSHGPKMLRKTTNGVLDALLHTVETAWHGHTLNLETLHKIVEGLKVSAQFDDFYRRAYRELLEIVEEEKLELKRQDAFGRLMIHPIVPLFDSGTVDRDLIPNIFQFLHLVLGDDLDLFKSRCVERVQAMREAMAENFTWDAFYDDPEAKRIFWRALVRIAQSFKRWDVRQDWFIKLMQYQPTSVSLGQSAFVMRDTDRHEQRHLFGKREFCAFFQALFRSMQHLDLEDEKLFKQDFGADPHHLIGDFLVHLSACEI